MSTATGMGTPMQRIGSWRLLAARTAVLLGRAWRSVGRGWAHWRKQVGERRSGFGSGAHGGWNGAGASPGVSARLRAGPEAGVRPGPASGPAYGLSRWVGRALAGKGVRNRMLAVEERLTLGPKQHLYLIRCGDRRLLVAGAGEGALQWMEIGEEAGPREIDACDDTLSDKGKAAADRTMRPAGGTRPRAQRKNRAESTGPKAAAEGTR